MFIQLRFGEINSLLPNTYAFSKSAIDIYTKNKNLEYRKKIIETIKEGKIQVAITPNELSGLEKSLGKGKYIKNYKHR